MDYERRLSAVRERMGERGVDLLVLPRAANLFYLTGIRRQLDHGTDHNTYGDWVSNGFIPQSGLVHLLAPRMGGAFWLAEAESKPWLAEPRLVREGESPTEVMRQTLAALGVEHPGRGVHLAVDDRLWARTMLDLQVMLPEAEFSSANELIAPLRAIKDEAELAALRKASDITDAVFTSILPLMRPGVSEREVASAIDLRFAELGAEFTSFETGVFFTGQAALTGGESRRAGERRLRPGDSVMFDFGGVVDGYCSDFGRSVYVGEPPAEYLAIHDAVIQAQAEAMTAMVAGRCTAAEANRIARQVIADAGYDEAFVHRLGHGIGVTVHEPPFLDGVDQSVLQSNMTFTVEPSVILPDRFANRIEDVVIVTEQGGVPLSTIERKLFLVE